MSKLTEAMDLLEPLLRADNWDGKTYQGEENPRVLLQTVWDDVQQVDIMMDHIAEVTSRPANPGERVRAAIGMAAAELPNVPSNELPALAMEALQVVEGLAPSDKLDALLRAAQFVINARLESRA